MYWNGKDDMMVGLSKPVFTTGSPGLAPLDITHDLNMSLLGDLYKEE